MSHFPSLWMTIGLRNEERKTHNSLNYKDVKMIHLEVYLVYVTRLLSLKKIIYTLSRLLYGTHKVVEW